MKPEMIFIRNVHPMEVTAFYSARETYRILKDKGYPVKLITMPFNQSNLYEMLSLDITQPGGDFQDLINRKSSSWQERIRKENPDAQIYDFHNTGVKEPIKDPSIEVIVGPPSSPIEGRIRDIKIYSGRYPTIEIPAIYKPLPQGMRQKLMPKLEYFGWTRGDISGEDVDFFKLQYEILDELQARREPLPPDVETLLKTPDEPQGTLEEISEKLGRLKEAYVKSCEKDMEEAKILLVMRDIYHYFFKVASLRANMKAGLVGPSITNKLVRAIEKLYEDSV